MRAARKPGGQIGHTGHTLEPVEILNVEPQYLGRYTFHKIAVSDSRILSYRNNSVRFSYKDYRPGVLAKNVNRDFKKTQKNGKTNK